MTSSEILIRLKHKKIRITNVRKAFVEIFQTNHRPMSAIEILMKCQERNLRINKTTVYRELHFFLKQKIIHEVHVFTDQALFESSYQPHHHHLICDKCHAIIDMPFQGVEQYIQNITRNARQTRGFFVQSHILELFGICNSCNVSALC